MKLPLTWLRACTGIEDGTSELLNKLTLSGVKAEGLEELGGGITNVVTGKVLSIQKHPDADRLLITKIDIGSREIQIVTGARNLSAGDYVPVALDGAELAGGKKIKRSKMRGYDSEGMLCDIGELGYTLNDYPEAPEDGIYIFQEPQPLGVDVKPILQLTDEVADFEITSNRPDCNSVLGVAREAAAVYSRTFNPPEINLKESGAGDIGDYIKIEIKNPDLCPRYAARVAVNVKIGPSPLWLRHRLTASGVRPINNIVDITNYVMLEYGQPLHAFDINHIAERRIVVRNAQKGERFTTLDGAERVLDETMLVIADAKKAVAVAGVMGGENSMITGGVQTVLFESANFDGTSIRLTSKKLGLRTDASARFEKGIDPELAGTAVDRAAELVELLNCGEVLKGRADAYPRPRFARVVNYSPANINKLLGADIEPDVMAGYLARIGIAARARGSEYEAEIPTFRADVTREADITEEIARLYGYNNIPPRFTQSVAAPGGLTHGQAVLRKINNCMVSLGYSEAVTYPFESPKVLDRLLIPEGDALRNAIRIQNPLGEDFSVMRTLPLGGLLESLSVNCNRRAPSARLYETAAVYRPKALPLAELPDEPPLLALAAFGENMDFFDFKGDVEALLAALGAGRLAFGPSQRPFLHPGRAASVSIAAARNRPAVELGYLGELHPRVCENYEIGARAYLAVLEIEPLLAFLGALRPAYKPSPKYPAVSRDLALKVKTEINAAAVETAIREKGNPLLEWARLFDVYQGKQVEEGYKSMAYTLSFRSPDRTLTDGEVTKQVTNILGHLSRKLGVVLREQ